MAIGDIFELKVFQNFGTRFREVLNVYHLHQITAGGNASSLMTSYLNTIDTDLRNIQSNIITTQYAEVRNLFNVTDFGTFDFTGLGYVGQVAQQSLPIHDALSMRLNRTSRSIRHGFKRFVGVPEGVVENGLINDAGHITLINTLAASLNGVWTEGDDSWELVVVKRIAVPPDEEHPNVRYRLPLTAEEAEFYAPTSVTTNLFVSTQNTRKR